MKERINKKMGIGIVVKTFHALGMGIIAKKEEKKPDIYKKSDKQKSDIMSSFIVFTLRRIKIMMIY